MDNNERTDQFFRERLSVYEEMPVDQVWDKIASRLVVEKRRKMIFLFLRIAAGMTLLLSLGVGYHLIYKSGDQNIEAVMAKPSPSEKSTIAPLKSEKAAVISGNQVEKDADNQSLVSADNYSPIASVNSGKNKITSQALNDKRSNKYTNSIYPASSSDMESTVPARMSMLKSSLLPIPAPHKLGYHRLSQEELLEQTAALLAENENGSDETEKDNRWMLGSEIAPLYSYRKIESDYLDKSTVQDMNKSEQGLIALAGGMRVGYAAGRRLSVQSGLYYSRYGQEKNNGKAISMDQIAYLDKSNVTYLAIPNSTGTIQAGKGNSGHYGTDMAVANGNKDFYNLNSGVQALTTDNVQITEGNISAVQYFDYLELPVTAKYKVIDRKLSLSFLGGLITNFLVNNGVVLKQNGNEETFGTTRDINKVNYQGSVGLGLDYPIMDRMAISLEPRFRYYLNPIDQRLNVHPYSFGIFAGISYSLK